MKIFLRVIATVLILSCCVFKAASQNTTNSGTEFWTAYMDHNNGASQDGTGQDNGSLMSLYITSAVNTSGTITIADGSFTAIPFSVTANQVTIVTIPPAAFLGEPGVFSKGIHIVSLKPIAIYAHIYAHSVSGATLLLPVSTLGKDYQSINYIQRSNAAANDPAYSAFIVIATEDNTTVQITPSQYLTDGHSANVPFTINLQKGQLYQALSVSDLSSSAITSVNSKTGGCTKIAVFSGSSRIEIGCNPNDITSDNLFQQVYPTATWGKNYVTVPLYTRNYDVFRIILSNPATTTDPNVKLNGTSVPLGSFENGYYEFSSQMPNVITADQPIQVVQYAVTEDNTINCGTFSDDVGDPEMIFLNPLEQTTNNVTLYSTGNFEILRSFINVVIKTSAVPTFTLDGNPYTSFKPVPNDSVYSYAQIPVQSGPQDIQSSTGSYGTHHISAGDSFNAIAYGFGQAESYGYAAGTNLLNLNENITLANPKNDTLTQTNGCLGVTYKLQLTLPYETTNIVWDFKNGTTDTISNPQYISTINNGGQTDYIYQYSKPVTYNTPGDTSVVATVFDPVAGVCGNSDVVEFDFNISAPPTAAFSSGGSCLGDSTAFTDKTNANGSSIKTWLWDFGDNTTSVLQNPKHLYPSPGNYKVSLTVTNVNGCATDTTQTVTVTRKPVASFAASAPDCAGQNVTFTDRSTTSDGKIIQWIWSYGDGKTDTLANGNPFTHTYASTGTDTIKLTVVTDGGCSSLANSQVITVNPPPVVDFSLPAVCLNDTFASFTNESTIADSTAAGFTYLWNFGDPNASAANPDTSALKNPSHKYTRAAVYHVTLTVTSASGCSASKTQSFTVNGATPVAAFTVENSNNLCSSDPVIFDDQSTVDFGNITKIVWYFDYNNDPQDSVVFLQDSIPANLKFSHNYGLFNAPLTKSYTVKMDVYSGITCASTTQQNINVNANPLVNLSTVGTICLNAQPVQIVQNTNGFNGTGVFTGPGVTPGGLFDPSVSGTGTFTLNYTFTSQIGCTYTSSQQVTVNPVPAVSLIPELVLLEGGQIQLPATATGDSLTYQWSPSTGLDHDNILAPIASPVNNTTYTLIATNAEGCSVAAAIDVNVLKYPVIPNTFTPNGDGINDTWNIEYLSEYPNNTVDVYDRYGQKVFSSTGYGTAWDGKYRGVDLPQGTYYYIINPKNGRKILSGSVTIIR